MRCLRKLAPRPLPLLSSSSYSTFSGGASGRGRGRGSGAPPPPQSPPPLRPPVDDDAFVPAGRGHGQPLPSWISTHPTPSAAAGRGRGLPPPPPPPQDPGDPKKPIFFSRDASTPPLVPNSSSTPPLPSRFAPILPGAGRGKPTKPADPAAKPSYENRHIRPHSPPAEQRPRLSAEEAKEATKKAIERLSRDGGGRGRGGRGMRGGRGRGGRFGDRRTDDGAEAGLFLGDNADGERLEKRLGEETMKKLNEEFEEMSYRVLPSPSEDAYLDALHTNNMIEYEPEYLVEFDRNPDIDEKPPMSLEDALEKAKPFLMAYEGIKSQEEWEEAIKETMEKVPHMKELIDMYCGPDRVTAKQQQQELERVAQTLPENIPSSVRRFTNRALLSLQSNPGWGWDKKCQFMDKLAWEVTQHYK